MSDDGKGLVERLRWSDGWFFEDPWDHVTYASDDPLEAADEIERLRLDVEAQEALQVSAYHAGLKAGWNFCVDDDHAGYQAAMASTDHIKELARIRIARAALKGTEQ